MNSGPICPRHCKCWTLTLTIRAGNSANRRGNVKREDYPVLYNIYRAELPNLGLTNIIVAWSRATPRLHWGSKIDSVSTQTGRDAADIYFKRAHLVSSWEGISTLETGVYCVTLKHSNR